PANNWKGIRLYSHSANGIEYCDLQDTWFGLNASTFSKANTCIQLDIDSSSGFVNNTLFSNHKMNVPIAYGMNWNATSSGHAFSQNTFVHEQVEMGSSAGSSLVAFNVDGDSQIFHNC